ncbi:MAG: D-alanyl-D-alanine carboxypeptidase, partial [Lachnospiraceae bacterium]|nr:D-alanyl-D-alanine carboxypeptidase [Lachnospiraceae bacterium]
MLVNIVIPVFADDIDDETLDYTLLQEDILNANSNISGAPQIYSRSAIVYDRTTKQILYGKNENTERPMASTTKIMTAIILIENSDLSQTVEVCKEAASVGGSTLGISTGDKITLNDLLYGLMLRSGNDAAVQIAITVAGSVESFAELMNNKTKELGLTHTHFVTPHGLDSEKHYTTAYELAVITDYALQNPIFAKVVSTKTATISINGLPKTINNTNELLGSLQGVNGVKTGFTNGAFRCLVTSVNRNNFN